MTLDKTRVARGQLGVALALFFEDLDPIVVHGLVALLASLPSVWPLEPAVNHLVPVLWRHSVTIPCGILDGCETNSGVRSGAQ
jgi:hypothetical protein